MPLEFNTHSSSNAPNPKASGKNSGEAGEKNKGKKFASPVPAASPRLDEEPVTLSIDDALLVIHQEQQLRQTSCAHVLEWFNGLSVLGNALAIITEQLNSACRDLDRMLVMYPLRLHIAPNIRSNMETIQRLTESTLVNGTAVLKGECLSMPASSPDSVVPMAMEKTIHRIYTVYQSWQFDTRLAKLKLLGVAGIETLDDLFEERQIRSALTQTDTLEAYRAQVKTALERMTTMHDSLQALISDLSKITKTIKADEPVEAHIRDDQEAKGQLHDIQDAVLHQQVSGLTFHTTRLTQLTKRLLLN